MERFVEELREKSIRRIDTVSIACHSKIIGAPIKFTSGHTALQTFGRLNRYFLGVVYFQN